MKAITKVLSVAMLLAVPFFMNAQTAPSNAQKEKVKERLKNLTPEQKEALKEKAKEKWNEKTPEEKEALKQKAKAKYDSASPEQKAKWRKRLAERRNG